MAPQPAVKATNGTIWAKLLEKEPERSNSRSPSPLSRLRRMPILSTVSKSQKKKSKGNDTSESKTVKNLQRQVKKSNKKIAQLKKRRNELRKRVKSLRSTVRRQNKRLRETAR